MRTARLAERLPSVVARQMLPWAKHAVNELNKRESALIAAIGAIDRVINDELFYPTLHGDDLEVLTRDRDELYRLRQWVRQSRELVWVHRFDDVGPK